MRDIVQGCETKEHAQRVLRAMAQVHGSHWGENIAEKYSWIPPLNMAAMKVHMSGAIDATLPISLEKLKKEISAELYQQMETFSGKVISSFIDECCTGNGFVLLHNDVKMENMFFEKTGDSICLIDWQTLRFGGILSIAHEVVQFLSRNVSVSILENSDEIDSLISYYLSELRKLVNEKEITVPTLKEFKGMLSKASVIALSNIVLLGSRLPFPRVPLPEGNETAQLKLDRHYAVFYRSKALMGYF